MASFIVNQNCECLTLQPSFNFTVYVPSMELNDNSVYEKWGLYEISKAWVAVHAQSSPFMSVDSSSFPKIIASMLY